MGTAPGIKAESLKTQYHCPHKRVCLSSQMGMRLRVDRACTLEPSGGLKILIPGLYPQGFLFTCSEVGLQHVLFSKALQMILS